MLKSSALDGVSMLIEMGQNSDRKTPFRNIPQHSVLFRVQMAYALAEI